jgi:hypothetical protein
MTPEGIGTTFDGLTPGTKNVWESKYNYESYFFGFNPKFTDHEKSERLIEMDNQKNTQVEVSRRCGYNLTWSFSEGSVADLLRERWAIFPPMPRIIEQRYIRN